MHINSPSLNLWCDWYSFSFAPMPSFLPKINCHSLAIYHPHSPPNTLIPHLSPSFSIHNPHSSPTTLTTTYHPHSSHRPSSFLSPTIPIPHLPPHSPCTTLIPHVPPSFPTYHPHSPPTTPFPTYYPIPHLPPSFPTYHPHPHLPPSFLWPTILIPLTHHSHSPPTTPFPTYHPHSPPITDMFGETIPYTLLFGKIRKYYSHLKYTNSKQVFLSVIIHIICKS